VALVFWLYRRAWFPPRGAPARQLWALWVGYVAGSIVLSAASRLGASPEVPYNDLTLYPALTVLGSLGFFMMGSSYWGYCYAYGAVFLVLALAMPLVPELAPLIFGAAWAVCLLGLATHLRRLAEESSTEKASD
jgi:hypothetical protein